MAAKQNAADPKDVRAREDYDSKDMDQLVEDTRAVMGTAEGRRFIWWMLEQAGIHRTTMTGNSYTYFNEGMRNLGLILENHVIEACDRQYLKMRDEHISRHKKRERALTEQEKKPEVT